MRIRNIYLLFLFAFMAGICRGDDAIQCANLIYGGTQTSKCFSDAFLSTIQKQTAIATEKRFKSVKLGSDELFEYPFVVMTGEQEFSLTQKERENLKRYLENGGFLLASAGCSSKIWSDAFKRNIKRVFGESKLTKIPKDHMIFRTVTDIKELELSKSSGTADLYGLVHDGKIIMVFSPEGLNDTANSDGCCCCGGNEIRNAIEVNMNIFVYALLN